jgi:hypothetical protein
LAWHSPQAHTGDDREGRGERAGERKRGKGIGGSHPRWSSAERLDGRAAVLRARQVHRRRRRWPRSSAIARTTTLLDEAQRAQGEELARECGGMRRPGEGDDHRGGGGYASARDRGYDPHGHGHGGRGARLQRGRGYARAKRLAGGSYTTARAERRAQAHGCADRAGPPCSEGGGRGVTGARSRAKWAERPEHGSSWASLAFLFPFEFLIHFPFIFSIELNSYSNLI